MAMSRIELDFSLASRSEFTLGTMMLIIFIDKDDDADADVIMMRKIPVNTELFIWTVLRGW